MIKALARIVQYVNMANDLNEVLEIIVSNVREYIKTDVCSVYLQSDLTEQEYVLMATSGLDPAGIGKVKLSSGRGLVGEVIRKGGGINVPLAQQHPNFMKFKELDEADFNGFCAVPIIDHRQILGVLVIQSRESREFSQRIVNFLLTIASQLSSSIIQSKMIIGNSIQLSNDRPISGIAVSPGVAIGPACLMLSSHQLNLIPNKQTSDSDAEIQCFRNAVEEVKQEIRTLSLNLQEENIPSEDIAIFDAYQMILSSKSFIEKTENYIHDGNWAPAALRKTIDEYIKQYQNMENRYLQDRFKDIADLGQSVLDKMLGNDDMLQLSEQSILVADDFSALTLSQLDNDKIKGIVSLKGAETSHVAIVARALGIPTVMGVSDIPLRQLESSKLIVDGYSGNVYVSPSESLQAEYSEYERQERQLSHFLRDLEDLPATTSDGINIPLYINLGVEEGMTSCQYNGAEGVGLFRTEFPFINCSYFPGERQQIDIYKNVLQQFVPNPVVLRTLDVGGDKPLSYFPIKEDNPFLGWRGIRICLDHPEIFTVQLRAMLIANQGLGNLRILLPMISSVDEIREALALLHKVYSELLEEDYTLDFPAIGVMIEVPSMIYQIKNIVNLVDFISIGSNDLIQYLLAVDRNNTRVAPIYQSMHPAVIQALNAIINDAHKYHIPVSLCGEIASDPMMCILLLGMEIDALSTNVVALSRIKWVIRSFSQQQAKQILECALEMDSNDEIYNLLRNELEQKGLAGLIRAGI